MTREEAKQSLEAVLSRLRYERVSQICELTPAACETMYDSLGTVQKYVDGPEAPALRKTASMLLGRCQDLKAGYTPELWDEAHNIKCSYAELQMLCDAVLALTVPTRCAPEADSTCHP